MVGVARYRRWRKITGASERKRPKEGLFFDCILQRKSRLWDWGWGKLQDRAALQAARRDGKVNIVVLKLISGQLPVPFNEQVV